jgi:hypothetical protein
VSGEHRCRRPRECATCIAASPRPGDLLTPSERAEANRYRRIYPWLEREAKAVEVAELLSAPEPIVWAHG